MKSLLPLLLVVLCLATAVSASITTAQTSAVSAAPAISRVVYAVIDDQTESYEISIAPVDYRINAYELQVSYDPKQFEAITVLPEAAACEQRFLIDRTIDATAGTVYIACGTITPPAVGIAMPLASVIFRRSEQGPPLIAIDPIVSAIYRHDGAGTRIPIQTVNEL